MDLPTLDDRLERRVAKVGRLNEAVRYLEKKVLSQSISGNEGIQLSEYHCSFL